VGLCEEGFCRPPEEDADGGRADENLQTHEGTGFGDIGDGDASLAQDVSEQVEDEEQLLGVNADGDKDGPSEPKADEGGEERDNSGFDMSTDFEGVLEDAPAREDEDEGNDGRDEGEEEPQPEKRMGDEDEAGADVIDEKLWDDEREDGAEDRTSAAKLEHGEEIEGGGRGPEADLVAREGAETEAAEEEEEERPQQDRPSRDSKKGDADGGDEKGTDGCGEDEMDVGADEPGAGGGGGGDAEDEEGEEGPSGKQPKLKMDDAGGAGLGDDAGDSDPDGEAGDETGAQDGSTDSEDPGEALDGNAMGENGNEAQHGGDAGAAGDGGADDANDGNGDAELPEDMTIDAREDEADGDSLLGEGEGDLCDPLDGQTPDVAAQGEEEDGENDGGAQGDGNSRDPGLYGEEAGNDGGEQDKVHGDSEGPEARGGHKDAALQVDVDDGEAMTMERNNSSAARGSEAAAGVSGGEMDTAASDRPTENRQGRNGTSGTGSVQELVASQSADAGGEDVGQHSRRGADEKDASNERAAHRSMDPNPHRKVATDVLLGQWERRLDMLSSSAAASDEGGDGDDAGTRGDLFEYVDDQRAEGTGTGDDASQEDPLFALGAATEEQHRPLPDGEQTDAKEDVGGRRDRDPGDGEEVASAGPDPASAPRAGRSSPAVRAGADGRDGGADGGDSDEAVDELGGGERQNAAEAAVDALEDRYRRLLDHATDATAAGRPTLLEDDEDAGEDVDEGKAREEALAIMQGTTREGMDERTAHEVWQRLDSLTSASAAALCEQLRLVLEPTLATGLAGDFRTGKRLNMRRVIEFVASDFRRDRIWLRRVRPEKRSYDVLIAIDDSESMADSGAGPLALEALSLLTSALARLEVGRVAVATFGTEARLVRGFDEPLPMDDRAGGQLLSGFTFSQKETDAKKLLEFVYEHMCGGGGGGGHGGDGEEVKLAFVVSDGRLSERDEVQRKIRELQTARVLVAFVVVDVVAGDRTSIFDVQRVEYQANRPGKMSVTPYMDKFPVQFYSVIRDVSVLPVTLGDALRQWFEVVNAT
jgi:midasin